MRGSLAAHCFLLTTRTLFSPALSATGTRPSLLLIRNRYLSHRLTPNTTKIAVKASAINFDMEVGHLLRYKHSLKRT